VTPIRKGTAKRLGLSKPISARVIAFVDHLGLELDPWQRWWIREMYPAYLRGEAKKRDVRP